MPDDLIKAHKFMEAVQVLIKEFDSEFDLMENADEFGEMVYEEYCVIFGQPEFEDKTLD